VQYCPTKEMVADYFTKPPQGILFYKFRDQIMGVVPMDTIIGDHRSVLDDHTTKAPLKENSAKVARRSPSSNDWDQTGFQADHGDKTQDAQESAR
jgi:hypothetical protein